MEMELTIFTPTYNREKHLKTLYLSLLNQSDKRFVWRIVDDGSVDDTAAHVDGWKRENAIPIFYVYQENHGKHVAHNTGVFHHGHGVFFLRRLGRTSSRGRGLRPVRRASRIAERPDIAGIIAKKRCRNGPEMCSAFPAEVKEASVGELYRVYRLKGELALIFKTEVLREFPFPVFGDEKFVTESVVLDRLSLKYKMKLLDKVVYLADYMPDGYTSNLTRIHRSNPVGYHFSLLQGIALSRTSGEIARARAAYICGCWKIRHKIELPRSVYLKNAPRAFWMYAKLILRDALSKSVIFHFVYRRVTGNNLFI